METPFWRSYDAVMTSYLYICIFVTQRHSTVLIGTCVAVYYFINGRKISLAIYHQLILNWLATSCYTCCRIAVVVWKHGVRNRRENSGSSRNDQSSGYTEIVRIMARRSSENRWSCQEFTISGRCEQTFCLFFAYSAFKENLHMFFLLLFALMKLFVPQQRLLKLNSAAQPVGLSLMKANLYWKPAATRLWFTMLSLQILELPSLRSW